MDGVKLTLDELFKNTFLVDLPDAECRWPNDTVSEENNEEVIGEMTKTEQKFLDEGKPFIDKCRVKTWTY